MTDWPAGKHYRVKRGPFAGKIGLWNGMGSDAYRLAFAKRGDSRDEGSLWFKVSDLEPVPEKDLEMAKK
jgi:hypothetical protein